MSIKVSKPHTLSKSAFLFFLMLCLGACSKQSNQVDSQVQNVVKENVEEQALLSAYLPNKQGEFNDPIEIPLSPKEDSLEGKVLHILNFLEENRAQGSLKTYGTYYRCNFEFLKGEHLFLSIESIGSTGMGLALEQISLLSLLKSFFAIEELREVSFFVKGQYAGVFSSGLILPKVIDRDFIKELEKQVKKRRLPSS